MVERIKGFVEGVKFNLRINFLSINGENKDLWKKVDCYKISLNIRKEEIQNVEKLQKKMIQHQIIHYKDDLNFMFDDIINAEKILIRKLKL